MPSVYMYMTPMYAFGFFNRWGWLRNVVPVQQKVLCWSATLLLLLASGVYFSAEWPTVNVSASSTFGELAGWFIRNERVINFGNHSSFLWMVRSIRIHFRIIRGLLRDVNSITGQTNRGCQKISLWSRNGLFFHVVYKKCWSTHCWLDVRQFSQLQNAIFVYRLCDFYRVFYLFLSSFTPEKEYTNWSRRHE